VSAGKPFVVEAGSNWERIERSVLPERGDVETTALRSNWERIERKKPLRASHISA
jgi:hypothetical protein